MTVLVDPGLDLELTANGFVVVELLDDGMVDRLLAAWEELSRSEPPVFDPTGLAATVRHPGLDHRADAHIRAVIEPLLAEVMVDRTPFMSSFLVKCPHSGELPAHIDWRLVDEPRQLTHGCWVPLTPAAADTGAFGVMPGSHLDVDFDRTPEQPGHDWAAERLAAGAPTELLGVEVGRAVIYDHRLVHFSSANDADHERIAINSGISAPTDEADARSRLLEMMARGMSAVGGSQIDPSGSPAAPDPQGKDELPAADDAADERGVPPRDDAPGARRRWWGRLRRG